MSDTIVALATPLGRSGIGVIRVSGPRALDILSRLTQQQNFDPRTSYLAKLADPISSELIDQAIVTYYRAPHSFTGEDVVEISCHGSPIVLRQMIDICLDLDARLAEAGEFSLRALANGRMDLTEAEAIRDLIDAQTIASARQAVKQLSGEFSHELQPIKDNLLDVIVVLESALEFVEDDLPDFQAASIRARLVSIRGQMAKIAATYRAGHLLREGLKVAIIGRPNVGKSSLFNALLGSERAIVTDIAGTTRDQLHEKLTIRDVPISLVDTAGLRDTNDKVETIGVERAKRTMADADVVLVLIDISEAFTTEDQDILLGVKDLNYIVVFNKIDKTDGEEVRATIAKFERSYPAVNAVAISAKTGSGIDDLKETLIMPFSGEDLSGSSFLISDARHHDLLNRSAVEISQSINALEAGASEEITLIGLHNAMRYLGQITGETTTEDMLTRIFATFCIGK